MRLARVVPLLALCAMLGACDTASLPVVEAQDGNPSALPRAVRPAFKAAMSRHAEYASMLTVSVALGAHEQTLENVDALLAEPRPAPAMADDPTTLNQVLPARLFELDEAFRAALGKLRGAAVAHDDELSITRLGSVLRACRNCHRALRTVSPAPPLR